MNRNVVICEVVYQFVDKVAPLVTYQFEQTFVPTPNILVDEFFPRCCVFLECLRFHPLGVVMGRKNDVTISDSCRGRFEWAQKIETPLLKRLEW